MVEDGYARDWFRTGPEKLGTSAVVTAEEAARARYGDDSVEDTRV